MTDKPHTPTTEQIELIVLAQLKQSAERHGLPHDIDADRADFRRWLSGVEAAAEQRGAIKALRDAAGAIEENNIVFDGDHYQPCNSCMSIHMDWLDYRADQMEGDE